MPRHFGSSISSGTVAATGDGVSAKSACGAPGPASHPMSTRRESERRKAEEFMRRRICFLRAGGRVLPSKATFMASAGVDGLYKNFGYSLRPDASLDYAPARSGG